MIHFGMIGTNFIADKFSDAVTQTPNCDIVGVYSRYLVHAESAAKRWDAKKCFTDLNEMLCDEEINAVYVSSPNKFHFEQGCTILKSGKHLFCEKPATITSQQFSHWRELAKQHHVILLEGMRSYFAPAFMEISNRFESLGAIRRAVLSYCQYSSRYDKFKAGIIENAFDPTLGNGALMDIGVYPIAVMIMLFGKPNKITATGSFLPHSIDAYGSVIADYKTMQVNISYSKINNSYHENEIQGEMGSLLFNPLAVPEQITVKKNDGYSEEKIISNYKNDMRYEVETFLKCMENPEITQRYQNWTQQTLEVIEEVRSQIGITFKK